MYPYFLSLVMKSAKSNPFFVASLIANSFACSTVIMINLTP